MRYILWVGIGALVLCGAFLTYDRRVSPVTLDEPLTLTKAGRVTQNGRVVGIMDQNNTLILPLVNPDTTSSIVFSSLTITAETGLAPETITPELISIQSLADSSAIWYDNTLIVSMGGLIPDAHTSLRLQAPPGTFHYSLTDRFTHAAAGLPFSSGLVLGALLVILTFVWVKFRNPHTRWQQSTYLSEPPEAITPIGLAILHHSSLTASDIACILYNLAQRGFLQLVSRGGQLLFVRTSLQEGLASYEQDLLRVLFPNNEATSQLDSIVEHLNKELFSQVTNQLYLDTYTQLDSKGYFEKNPRLLHLEYKTLAIILQLLGIIGVILASFIFQALYAWILPVSAGIYLMGWFLYRSAPAMSRLSLKGTAFATECGKFISYLTSRKPIGTEGNQGFLFYTYVPFALVTGTLGNWLYRFREESFYIPDWYLDEDEAIVHPDRFVSRLLELSDKLATTITTVKDPNVD